MYKLVTVLAVALVLAVGLGQSIANKRSFGSGKYALDLDNVYVGAPGSCDGGESASEVIEELQADGTLRKRPGRAKYSNITLKCGAGMSKSFYTWIQDSFDHKYSRKNGAIIAADYNYKAQGRMTFTDALITEIGFPALDAVSKDPAYMTLRFAPETTGVSLSPGGGTISAGVQKKWLPANFRLRIDGLEAPCSRVNKIEALTIKQKVTVDPIGEQRIALEIPNLVITLPESHAKPLYDWHEDFVIKGNNGDDQEKGGSLEYLAADLSEVLFTLTFRHLGIFKVAPDKAEAGGESIRRIKAEMYCEEMKFDYYKAASALKPGP